MTLLWIMVGLVIVMAYFAIAYGRRAFQAGLDLRDLYAALVFATLGLGFVGVFHWIKTGAPRPPAPLTWALFGVAGLGYLGALTVRIAHLIRSRKR